MSDTLSNREPASNKRQRTDADEPLEEDVVKDTEVWLHDGNIVVISKNIAFRVHKSVLSLHSEVFRDLFLLPPPPGDEQSTSFEGCPTVRMPDTPEDLRHLLLVVCCGKDYYHENDEIVPVPCKVLCSLIRMGHKYAIPKVLNDALSRLKRYYTSDLSLWDDQDRRGRYVTVGAKDHIPTIQVAHLTNTPSILPSAFLDMAYFAEDDIVTLSKCGAQCQCGLSPELVRQALRGKAAIIANITGRLLAIHTVVPASKCPTPERCTMVAHQVLRTEIWMGGFRTKCSIVTVFQPLCAWYWREVKDRLCPSCMNASRTTDEDLRKSEWKELPRFFSLKIDDWPA
ncbi:hypothetical protein LXA43DRAFT_1028058 [Ganoderma leucocontextum]|nr:hypothetical protein LXA43DRAFT_1028058 [Ganoderma leucocontextum]